MARLDRTLTEHLERRWECARCGSWHSQLECPVCTWPFVDPEAERRPWYRASGDMLCGCGRAYYRHRSDANFSWLVVLCDGQRVKL